MKSAKLALCLNMMFALPLCFLGSGLALPREDAVGALGTTSVTVFVATTTVQPSTSTSSPSTETVFTTSQSITVIVVTSQVTVTTHAGITIDVSTVIATASSVAASSSPTTLVTSTSATANPTPSQPTLPSNVTIVNKPALPEGAKIGLGLGGAFVLIAFLGFLFKFIWKRHHANQEKSETMTQGASGKFWGRRYDPTAGPDDSRTVTSSTAQPAIAMNDIQPVAPPRPLRPDHPNASGNVISNGINYNNSSFGASNKSSSAGNPHGYTNPESQHSASNQSYRYNTNLLEHPESRSVSRNDGTFPVYAPSTSQSPLPASRGSDSTATNNGRGSYDSMADTVLPTASMNSYDAVLDRSLSQRNPVPPPRLAHRRYASDTSKIPRTITPIDNAYTSPVTLPGPSRRVPSPRIAMPLGHHRTPSRTAYYEGDQIDMELHRQFVTPTVKGFGNIEEEDEDQMDNRNGNGNGKLEAGAAGNNNTGGQHQIHDFAATRADRVLREHRRKQSEASGSALTPGSLYSHAADRQTPSPSMMLREPIFPSVTPPFHSDKRYIADLYRNNEVLEAEAQRQQAKDDMRAAAKRAREQIAASSPSNEEFPDMYPPSGPRDIERGGYQDFDSHDTRSN